MSYFEDNIPVKEKFEIHNLLPEIGARQIRNEIFDGLKTDQKYISSKYFYNEKGSKLFESITQLPEYYPTRVEKSILKDVASEIMGNNSHTDIIELGSGDCSKISILLDEIADNNIDSYRYIPVDVSASAVENALQILKNRYPFLNVFGYVADFIHHLAHLPRNNPALFLFLGSTLGNFDYGTSMSLLKSISQNMQKGDKFLLGLDLVKPHAILHNAYNDQEGITAQFNLNILNSINEIAQSKFSTDDFIHHAFFNQIYSRIEMHLVAKKNLIISSPFFSSEIFINKGESIHTENSHKFKIPDIEDIASSTGLRIKNIHTDNQQWFALAEFDK